MPKGGYSYKLIDPKLCKFFDELKKMEFHLT